MFPEKQILRWPDLHTPHQSVLVVCSGKSIYLGWSSLKPRQFPNLLPAKSAHAPHFQKPRPQVLHRRNVHPTWVFQMERCFSKRPLQSPYFIDPVAKDRKWHKVTSEQNPSQIFLFTATPVPFTKCQFSQVTPLLKTFRRLFITLMSEVGTLYLDLHASRDLSPAVLCSVPLFTLTLPAMTLPSIFKGTWLLPIIAHLSSVWQTPLDHNNPMNDLILLLAEDPFLIFRMCVYHALVLNTGSADRPSVASLHLRQQNCYHDDQYCYRKYWPLSDKVYWLGACIDISLQRKRSAALKYVLICACFSWWTVKIEKEIQRKRLAQLAVVGKSPPPLYFGGICVNCGSANALHGGQTRFMLKEPCAGWGYECLRQD